MRPFQAAFLLTATLATGTAGAGLGNSWPLVAFDQSEDCELAITGNGGSIQIKAKGLIPGETLGLTIRNGDMRPIVLSPRADDDGSLLRYYQPFRFGRDGGVVAVSLDGARCSLRASAPWSRGVRTIP